jgi:hypothetical protein
VPAPLELELTAGALLTGVWRIETPPGERPVTAIE